MLDPKIIESAVLRSKGSLKNLQPSIPERHRPSWTATPVEVAVPSGEDHTDTSRNPTTTQ